MFAFSLKIVIFATKIKKLKELKKLSLRSSIRTGVKDDTSARANKKAKVMS